MRKKVFGVAGVLGLAVLLGPDFSHGQPPPGFGGNGGGGKGFKMKGGDRGPGSYTGQPGGPQPGGPQGGGGPGGPSGRGGPPDPDRLFGFLARGGESIDMTKMDPDQQRAVTVTFERMGMPAPPPNAVITRQQFTASFSQAMAARAAAGGGQPGAGGPGGRGGPTGDPNADAEERFKRYDQNGDGRIDRNEAAQSGSRFMSGPSFDQMDTNRDGFVDLAEYKAFRANMAANGMNRGPGGPPGYDPNQQNPGYPPPGGYQPGYPPPGGDPNADRGRRGKKEEEPELVAVRYGKLPQGLPDWFTDLDTDKDGMVGLYEWRTAGRPTAEFREMDLDGDGLISPGEYFAYVKVKEDKERAENGDRPASRTGSRGTGGDSGTGYRGPWGGGNGGQGGNRGQGGSPDAKGGDRRGPGGPPDASNGSDRRRGPGGGDGNTGGDQPKGKKGKGSRGPGGGNGGGSE